MTPFTRLFVVCLIGITLSGCTANQARYGAPLYDVGVLSQESGDEWGVEEISFDDLDKVSPGIRPAIDTDEAGLWMTMDQAEEQIKTSGHLVHDEKLDAYLKDIACRLVPNYCDDIRIYLLQIPYFNASMAPNGAMMIWTGLLLRVENEAQLAAIIGHEIGHYLRRHSLERMKDIINTSGALVFVQLATAAAGVSVAGDIVQLLAVGTIQKFSRDQEREADGYGIALMARAGYDPRENAKIWNLLIEEEEADKDKKWESIYFASHPAPKERHEALKKLGERVVDKGRSYSLGTERFQENILSHQMEHLRDELNLRNFGKTEWLLDTLIRRGDNLCELHFCKGELYRLRGEDGDNEKALQEYEIAAQMGSPPPETYRAMGLIYMKDNRKEEAVNAFNTYLELSSEPSDEQMILHMIKEIEQ